MKLQILVFVFLLFFFVLLLLFFKSLDIGPFTTSLNNIPNIKSFILAYNTFK